MSVQAKRLDHVAIAVHDLDKAIEVYRGLLGLELTHVEEVPAQQVRVAIFGRGPGRIELICPTRTESGVSRFLSKRGEGLHHICLEVEDIERSLAALKSQGAALIDAAPRPGSEGSKVAFVHPKGMCGVLTELRQGPEGSE